MELTRKEVEHIAALARMSLTEHEMERLGRQLSDILQNMEALREVDTAGVLPTAQSLVLENVFREDEVCESLAVQDVLANAPDREGDTLKVRPVLE